jgi:plastocyanin
MRSLTVASLLVCAPGLLAGDQSATGTASVSGKVSFEGTVPPPVKLQVSSDAACQALHPQGLERRAIVVEGGGLANALVYVKSGVSGVYPPPPEPVVLDQQGCQYVPSVVALQVGQALKIRNSDGTFHNVRGFSAANGAFNIAQPRKGMEATRTFERAELLFPVRCDMHPWMLAFVAVLPHPFHAVTAPDGAFEIKGLPAGTYEVEAIHDKLEPVTAKVSVREGEAAQLNLSLKE